MHRIKKIYKINARQIKAICNSTEFSTFSFFFQKDSRLFLTGLTLPFVGHRKSKGIKLVFFWSAIVAQVIKTCFCPFNKKIDKVSDERISIEFIWSVQKKGGGGSSGKLGQKVVWEIRVHAKNFCFHFDVGGGTWGSTRRERKKVGVNRIDGKKKKGKKSAVDEDLFSGRRMSTSERKEKPSSFQVFN